MPPRSCALLLVVSIAAGASVADARPANENRIRCLDKGGRQLFLRALADSPTVSRLAARIERSDVFVMLTVGLIEGDLTGTTRFLTSASGARYVAVRIDLRASSVDLVGRLAHELQHVAEIVDAPEVRDEPALRAMLSRIGRRTQRADSWETQEAIETGRRAAREAASRPAHVVDIAREGLNRRAPGDDR
jgi:hypothetical protein